MGSGREKFERHKGLLDAATAILRRAKPIARFILGNGFGTSSIALGLRYASLRALAAECGTNVYVDNHVRLKNLHNLRVGSNVSIHSFCYIDAEGGISIGDDVSIAHGTSILSTEHSWDDPRLPIKYNPTRMLPTVIEDDVWIGCGCRLLGGTHVGSRCIVAAGAVVKGRLEPARIYGGVPARELRSIPEAVPTLPA